MILKRLSCPRLLIMSDMSRSHIEYMDDPLGLVVEDLTRSGRNIPEQTRST
jgi:hypothetical protein